MEELMAVNLARQFCKKQLPATTMILLVSLFCAAWGGEPAYTRIDFEKVPALEIEGKWDAENSVFVARKIEELPKERRPKFRGEIQEIDLEKELITVYGIPIEIDDETQFSDSDSDLEDLKVGQRVEVSCKVREAGNWEASKIKITDVKESDKVKGTVTAISIDGDPPDTLKIHRLLIILTAKTKVVEAAGYFEDKEDDIWGDLKSSRLYYDGGGLDISDRFTAYAEYRQSIRDNREFDLSDNYDFDNNNAEPEIRLELIGNYNRHLQSFAQLRVREKYYFNDNRINPPPDDLQADITQLYLLARNIGNRGFALQIGRQDFDERREWLFDEYLDAARGYYYGLDKFIFNAAYINNISPVNDKYETWTDFLLQARYFPDHDNFFEVYTLLRKDSEETRNREPVYYGARYYGNPVPYLRLWAEGSLLDGEDKGKSQSARAFDLGATFSPGNMKFSPSITMAYATGTGDKTGADNISNEFRQTGYQDNTDYFGGYKTIQYYGELLDPELSNLIIKTLGAGIKPHSHISAEIIYHDYKQDHPDDNLRGNLIDPPARPNGVSDDIGREFDFIFAVVNIWGRFNFSWILAIFSPGAAFSPRLNDAAMNKFDIKVDI
jgi:alginate production protein